MASIYKRQSDESSSGDQIHLADYLSVVVESWRLIAGITFAVVILGILYAVLARPIYRADVMIQVEDSASSTKDALGELASIFDTKQTAAAEIELIRSRLVVTETVQRLHLDINAYPRYFPLIGRAVARKVAAGELAPAFFGLSKFAWGGESIQVPMFEVPKSLYGTTFVLTARENGNFDVADQDGDIVLRGKAGTLSKDVKDGKAGDPATGMTANGPIEIQVDALVARPGTQFMVARSSTLGTIDQLQDALTIAEKTKQSGVIGATLDGEDSARTALILNTIASAYVQQNIDRKSAEAEHTLAFLNQQLPQLRAQLDKAEDRYNAFRNEKGTVDLSAESRLLLQQIVDSKTKLADLEQQRVEMVQRFTSSHPAVAALTAQINLLQEQGTSLDKQVIRLPDTEQSALRLLRDVRVDTELYTNLLDAAQQLRIVKAGEVGNVRVVDYAVADDVPVRPRRVMTVGLAGVLGLVIGTVAAFVRKTLFGGVEHSEEIEEVLGLPVYAVVPHSEAQIQLWRNIRRGHQGQNVLAASAPEDVAVEGIRSLRTALEFGLLDARNNIVMITGPRPEVGKSFMAVNLSAVLASSSKRVLLIDADMRRGDAHTYLGVNRSPGLSDAIGARDIEGAVLHDVLPGLDFLPKGLLPPNPAELLMSERFKNMLDYFSTRYDIVIVDTPPVLAVTDAALIGKFAGTTLLVVRHGRNPMSEIAETAKRLRNGGVMVKGVLFSDVPQRRIGYGAYYSGYYGYQSSTE
ncbi:polysaccharide biosynthesis tyrosine autokinase [Paraburkholderia madseniana]|uniref:polysaccharide biosynthesis tyrosine autokinase n=1 Tax=Paraburkholderia madseniana TaxID=2599607 RepID=UPI0038BC8B40